ncbi:MAG: ATP-dependent 6-phosphofructokinase, partial [Candidatus Bathyarchaeota archaeon]
TARSRFLANLFAKKAVELVTAGLENHVVGLQKGAVTSIELEKSCGTEKVLDLQLLELAEMLAT